MRSSLPKVLHKVAGQSLLAHVLAAAPHSAGDSLAVVVGPDHQAVADEARRTRPDAETFIQSERLGTAHAVLAAKKAIEAGADDLLVAFGDTPLITAFAPPIRPATAGCWSRATNWSQFANRRTLPRPNGRSRSAMPG